MNGFELSQDLRAAMQDAEDTNNARVVLAVERAGSEIRYRTKLMSETLRIRAERKYPAGLSKDLAFCSPEVTELYVEFVKAEAIEAANIEAINLIKRRIDTDREQLARDWSQAAR